MLGLPTVLITLVPSASAEMGPPRAIHPVGFTLGDALGLPAGELARVAVEEGLQAEDRGRLLHALGDLVPAGEEAQIG